MQRPDWKKIWTVICKYTPNKYILTLLIFAFIFLFAGEQSLIKNIKRRRQIRETTHAINQTDRAVKKSYERLNTMQQIDSLERYAREHYLMHRDCEDVYLVGEE